jgi:hypothetical protein
MALSQKYSDLTKAVIHQFGSESDFLESAQDIADHGDLAVYRWIP